MEPLNPQVESGTYLTFLMRAHRERNEHNTSFEDMRALILAEQKSETVQHLPPFEELFVDVQNQIVAALDKMLAWDLTQGERTILNAQQKAASCASTVRELVNSIKASLSASHRFAEY